MTHAIYAGILALALLPLSTTQPAPAQPAPQDCENVIPHEPLLQFEISGHTLAAMVDRNLMVWADGSMRLSQASDAGTGTCFLAQTSPEEVQALHRALAQLGAFAGCDEEVQVTDMPLSTLTLFRGTQDSRVRTFSWWENQGEYAAYAEQLEKFVANHFPGQ